MELIGSRGKEFCLSNGIQFTWHCNVTMLLIRLVMWCRFFSMQFGVQAGANHDNWASNSVVAAILVPETCSARIERSLAHSADSASS
jgi:hypothetical protein